MTKKKIALKKPPAMTTDYGRGYRAGRNAERKRSIPIIRTLNTQLTELDTKARKYKILMNAADVEVYKLTRACETIAADRDAERLDKEAAMRECDDWQTRAENQYEENVALIAETAALQAALDKARATDPVTATMTAAVMTAKQEAENRSKQP